MKKKELIWSLVAVAIATISIWAVVSQAKNFSFDQFMDYVGNANPFWLSMAFLCMLGFIVFEGLGLRKIISAFGYPKDFNKGCLYSCADIYFSSITPSATGGQPACAYFMIRDGIPTAVSTVALLVNLILYTLAIMVVGIIAVIFHPIQFLHFNDFSKVMIVIGYACLGSLTVLFALLLRKAGMMHTICDALLSFLSKVHLVRKVEKKRARLKKIMDDYAACAAMIDGQRKMLWQAFLFNFLQRASQICVPAFLYLATGGGFKGATRVWSMQAFVTIGSNCVPIPGAMGIIDYLLIDGLGGMMSDETAIRLELLSRSISFYTCVIISAIIVAIGYVKRKYKVVITKVD